MENNISINNSMIKTGIRKKVIILGSIISGSIILLLYFVGMIFYHSHFYHNTIINGVNCSNQTPEQAEQLITKEANTYQLVLKERNNMSETISGKEISLKVDFQTDISELLKNQTSALWIFHFFGEKKYDNQANLSFDENLLNKKIDGLQCFDKDKIVNPKDATIAYKDGKYEIVECDKGTVVIKENLAKEMKASILNLEGNLSLEDKNCYQNPAITSESDVLKNNLETANKYVQTTLTYQFGDKTEVLDGSKINQWIKINGDKVIINQKGVDEFVDYLGSTYNTFGKVRKFKTSYGKTIQLKGGDYGWWLDRNSEEKEILKAIKAGKQETKEPVYFQKAASFGETDIGDTYVEVNLGKQHLFFYKNGKKVLESNLVSGNISKDHGTPVGTYPIQYCETDAVLVGEDYETPVKYWMPFNGDIGLHDATWRSQFGGNIYKTRGSHGCVNLPFSVAETIFKNVQKGTPVVVYDSNTIESVTPDKTKTDKTKTDKTKTDKTDENTDKTDKKTE